MPVPAVIIGGDVHAWMVAVQAFLSEAEERLAALETPQSPTAVFACLKADLPAAASHVSRLAYATDTKILVVSDGTVWRRQDTGAPI